LPERTELRSTRNPTWKPRLPGENQLRFAERANRAGNGKYQQPPRITRYEPEDDPVGSVTEPLR
jgi:hypothetical protein